MASGENRGELKNEKRRVRNFVWIDQRRTTSSKACAVRRWIELSACVKAKTVNRKERGIERFIVIKFGWFEIIVLCFMAYR